MSSKDSGNSVASMGEKERRNRREDGDYLRRSERIKDARFNPVVATIWHVRG
jgi:hypothetical protein